MDIAISRQTQAGNEVIDFVFENGDFSISNDTLQIRAITNLASKKGDFFYNDLLGANLGQFVNSPDSELSNRLIDVIIEPLELDNIRVVGELRVKRDVAGNVIIDELDVEYI